MEKQKQIETGGAAFPQFTQDAWKNPLIHGGMSLRDYFAGQALRGISEDYLEVTKPDQLAIECYRIADAMLKARNIQPNQQPTTISESTIHP